MSVSSSVVRTVCGLADVARAQLSPARVWLNVVEMRSQVQPGTIAVSRSHWARAADEAPLVACFEQEF